MLFRSGGGGPSSVSQGKRPLRSPSGSQGVSISASPSPSSSRVSSRLTTPAAGGRPGITNQSVAPPRGVSTSSKASSTRQSSASSTRTPPTSNSGYTYPASSRQTRHNVAILQQQHTVLDPHHHPTAPPPPASALSIWLTAHRYSMPGLCTLALTHIMNTSVYMERWQEPIHIF